MHIITLSPIIIPSSIGVSLDNIATTIALPNPGRLNTCSTTTAPPSTALKKNPHTVSYTHLRAHETDS